MMSRSYSLDLRERVVAAVLGGATTRSAAARYGFSVATAMRWSPIGASKAPSRGAPAMSGCRPPGCK